MFAKQMKNTAQRFVVNIAGKKTVKTGFVIHLVTQRNVNMMAVIVHSAHEYEHIYIYNPVFLRERERTIVVFMCRLVNIEIKLALSRNYRRDIFKK